MEIESMCSYHTIKFENISNNIYLFSKKFMEHKYQRIYSYSNDELDHKFRLREKEGFFYIKGYWAKVINTLYMEAKKRKSVIFLKTNNNNVFINIAWKEEGFEYDNDLEGAHAPYRKKIPNVSKKTSKISFWFDTTYKIIAYIHTIGEWMAIKKDFVLTFQSDKSILKIIPVE
jgi:hypothetical protein